MKKKVLAVLLTAAMAVSLTACGANGGSNSKDGSGSSDTQTQESDRDASDGAENSEEGENGSEDSKGQGDAGGKEFNPDKAEDAMSIEEIREKNGAEVPVEADWKLGVVMKSLSNEFWRTLQEGYEIGRASCRERV